MTDGQKKMKQYSRAVARHLNLPKELKARVMSDFISDLQARQESGMTEEEIYTELGSPRQAAEELNRQMKEYTYRKSPWRFLFAACAAYGAAELLGSLIAWLAYLMIADPVLRAGEAASVGLIGGADGPTAIFITTPGWSGYVIPAVALVVGIWGFLRLCRCRQK